MATFNGLQWLHEQVNSILEQVGVNVVLFISDDFSTDGTWEWLQEFSNHDSRVILLPRTRKLGGPGANFYRLLLDADFNRCDYIAFSDQDDIWMLDKLSRQVDIANLGNFDGVSSNVTAFWQDGSSVLIKKSQSQQKFDYLFESAGPGCTFLMTPWLASELRKLLGDSASCAKDVAVHDWLAYAVCRAAGKYWHIDAAPTVMYRQHETNAFGANHGLQAWIFRLNKIKNRWYRNEVMKISRVCTALACDFSHKNLTQLLHEESLINRIKLLRHAGEFRRRANERVALILAIFLFVF